MRTGQTSSGSGPDLVHNVTAVHQEQALVDGDVTPAHTSGAQVSPLQPSERDATLRLGDILIQQGLITEAQMQEALHIQKTLPAYKPVGHILVEQAAITSTQLTYYLEKYHKQLQLSDVLLKSRLITESQLHTALTHQQQTGLPLGTTLLRLNYLSEEALKQALCLQLNIPFVDLDGMNLDRSLTRLLNKHYARRHQLVPVSCVGTTLTVAIEDPTDTEVIRDLQASTGCTINIVTSTHAAIRQAFGRVYDVTPETTASAEHVELMAESPAAPTSKSRYVEEYHEHRRADEIVKHLIALAISHRASDIHLNPVDQHMYVRFRIDGMLQALYLGTLEDAINANQGAIVSRIKILGKLDIAEKRRPQDGSFRVQTVKDGHIVKIDFRIPSCQGIMAKASCCACSTPATRRSRSTSSASGRPLLPGCAISCSVPPASS